MAKQTDNQVSAVRRAKTRMDTDTVFQHFSCILSVSDFLVLINSLKKKDLL